MSHIHLLSSRHDRVEKWYFSLYRVFDASTRRTVIVIVFLAQKRKPLFLVSFFLLFFLFFVEQFFLTALTYNPIREPFVKITMRTHSQMSPQHTYNTENTYVPILRATHIRNVYIHSCTIHSSVKKEKKKNNIGKKKYQNWEFRSYNYRLAVPTFKKMNEKPCITSRVSSM